MNRSLGHLAAMLVVVSTVTGCVSNPINAYTGSRYYDYGLQAEQAGDLALARQNFYRAYVNAQMGYLGPAAEASCLYEWLLVTGYLGRVADAEKGFNDVLELIGKANGKADRLLPPTLSELARLLHDTNQHTKAVSVYERALAALEKTTVAKDDPIAFATFLDDYSDSLRVAGFVERADEVSQRASAIRKENKGLTARFVARRYKAEPVDPGNGTAPQH